jgi:LPS-assembly protein
VLATEVSRRFGELRHTIVPRLEWRAGTGSAGEGIPWYAYDLFDRTPAGFLTAAPSGTWQQLRASVETRLTRGGATLARLELGQDYDAHLERFGETFGGADVSWRGFYASASARAFAIDPRPYPAPPPPPGSLPTIPNAFLDHFTQLGASAGISDARGDRVGGGYFSVAAGGSGTLVAGIDPLFDARPAATEASATAVVGARAVWSGATLGYDVLLYGRDAYVGPCPGGGSERHVQAGEPQQHVGTFVWDSPCHCFRSLAVGRLDDCGGHSGQVSLEFSRFGASAAR